MIRPRVSLRWLLLFTAIFAGVCYWWIVRPTVVANQFAKRVNAKDVQKADAMVANPKQWSLKGEMNPDTFNFSYSGPIIWDFDLQLLPRDWNDLFRGERRMSLQILYQRKGTAEGEPPVVPIARKQIQLKSTPEGIAWVANMAYGR